MWPLIRRGVPAFTVGEQCDKGLVLRRSILKFHVALCTCLSYWTWVFSSIKNDCLSFTMGISWEKIRKAPNTMPDKLYVLDLIVAVIYFWPPCEKNTGFPGDSGVKNLLANAGHVGSTPGSGRSPGRGHGHPLQYSCLENPADGGPGGLQPMRPQGVGYDWASTCAQREKSSSCRRTVWEGFFQY